VRAAGEGEAEVRAIVGGAERSAYCRLGIAPDGTVEVPAIVTDETAAADGPDAVEEVRQRLEAGARVGPMHGARVRVLHVRRPPEGGEALVQQAAAKALALAIERAGLVELEPWVALELRCPEDGSQAVMADLGARGATVSGVSSGRLGAVLHGRAPLSRMLGYVTKLRSMTKGKGQVSMRPDGFAPVK
jgi:elongation factor G